MLIPKEHGENQTTRVGPLDVGSVIEKEEEKPTSQPEPKTPTTAGEAPPVDGAEIRHRPKINLTARASRLKAGVMIAGRISPGKYESSFRATLLLDFLRNGPPPE